METTIMGYIGATIKIPFLHSKLTKNKVNPLNSKTSLALPKPKALSTSGTDVPKWRLPRLVSRSSRVKPLQHHVPKP